MIPVTIPRWSLLATLLALLVLLAGMAYMVYQDHEREYRTHQERFRQLVADRLGPEKAAGVETGLKQIWVPEIGVIDRCVTCHQGVGWEGLKEMELPFGNHSRPELIKKHPIDRFGCTPCHGGQGLATNSDDAHSWFKRWEFPGPDTYLAKSNRFKNNSGFLESRCNFCHRYETEVAGMALLNHGKLLIDDNGCRDCHTINGYGGRIGPDLTYEGDRDPTLFNFAPKSIMPKTVYSWHMAHFYYPKSVKPTSIMPKFRFTSRDLHALTLLVMSWKKNNYPVNYLPHIKMTAEFSRPLAD